MIFTSSSSPLSTAKQPALGIPISPEVTEQDGFCEQAANDMTSMKHSNHDLPMTFLQRLLTRSHPDYLSDIV
jgi:hypothetical protein